MTASLRMRKKVVKRRDTQKKFIQLETLKNQKSNFIRLDILQQET